MSKMVIVGGATGLGCSILSKISDRYDECVLYDVRQPLFLKSNIRYVKADLFKESTSFFKEVIDSDCLIITAGIGSVKPFENISLVEIEKTMIVDAVSIIKIIKLFYKNLLKNEDAKCMVVGSIAGEVSSPLFSVYGASKSALIKFCESVNVELEMSKSKNRITCISAVSFEGTSFNGRQTDLSMLSEIADECIIALDSKEKRHYINDSLCKDIIKRYIDNKEKFGIESYRYKIENGRISNRSSIVVGYLSGTFDLFHIGHLNLLKRAKEQCDYLIVGVHESGSWKGKETFIPFEERIEIVKSCKYVDSVCKSFSEDSDAWKEFHYDKLFVGSDYKGSERFAKYEEFFKDKSVEIVYFPYTNGTSSTQLRERLINNK